MSDNLRDALEELAAERDSVSGHVGSDYHIRPYELRELLAAHPAEPASEWTEEECGFVETALNAADAGNAGHWPTVAAWLAAEVRRLRAAGAS